MKNVGFGSSCNGFQTEVDGSCTCGQGLLGREDIPKNSGLTGRIIPLNNWWVPGADSPTCKWDNPKNWGLARVTSHLLGGMLLQVGLAVRTTPPAGGYLAGELHNQISMRSCSFAQQFRQRKREDTWPKVIPAARLDGGFCGGRYGRLTRHEFEVIDHRNAMWIWWLLAHVRIWVPFLFYNSNSLNISSCIFMSIPIVP